MLNHLALSRFLGFFALVNTALVIEYLLLNLTNRLRGNSTSQVFTFQRYFYYLSLPILIILYYLRDLGSNIALIVLAFAFFGTLAEWIIGYSYHRIVGSRLWTYHRLALGGYTSLLSFPLWGLAGLIFYLFMQIFI